MDNSICVEGLGQGQAASVISAVIDKAMAGKIGTMHICVGEKAIAANESAPVAVHQRAEGAGDALSVLNGLAALIHGQALSDAQACAIAKFVKFCVAELRAETAQRGGGQ